MTELLFQVHNHIESYWAADGSSMSIGTMDEVRLPGADAVLAGGYGQLISRLAWGLDIRTEQQVTRVLWRQATQHSYAPGLTPHLSMVNHPNKMYHLGVAGGTAVPLREAEEALVTCCTAAGAMYRARRVVVTLPLGVLKSGAVAFDPPLEAAGPQGSPGPVKASAIQRLGTGMYNKVMLVFDHVFWDDHVMIHRIPPSEERGRWAWILNLHRVLGAPILVAFTTGTFAMQMEQLPDDVVGEELLLVLRRLYPGKVPRPRRVICTRWGSDPHSRMSFTYLPVGAGAEDCEALRQPMENRLFFAGEATSRLFYGTVHGAYGTGLQAAEEVVAAEAAEALARSRSARSAAVGAAAWVGAHSPRAREHRERAVHRSRSEAPAELGGLWGGAKVADGAIPSLSQDAESACGTGDALGTGSWMGGACPLGSPVGPRGLGNSPSTISLSATSGSPAPKAGAGQASAAAGLGGPAIGSDIVPQPAHLRKGSETLGDGKGPHRGVTLVPGYEDGDGVDNVGARGACWAHVQGSALHSSCSIRGIDSELSRGCCLWSWDGAPPGARVQPRAQRAQAWLELPRAGLGQQVMEPGWSKGLSRHQASAALGVVTDREGGLGGPGVTVGGELHGSAREGGLLRCPALGGNHSDLQAAGLKLWIAGQAHPHARSHRHNDHHQQGQQQQKCDETDRLPDVATAVDDRGPAFQLDRCAAVGRSQALAVMSRL